jgi:transglutaminase-like putative cysteine protease
MAELVRESMMPARRKSLDLMGSVYATRPSDYVEAVRNFVGSSVLLVGEPDELIISPRLMLANIEDSGRIYGDCDDAAVLVAALLYGIGIPVRFKAINQAADGSYQHVFAEYNLGGGWMALDTTALAPPVYEAPWEVYEI